MPLDAQHGWQRAEMVTAGEIMAMLRTAFTLTPDPAERGGAPAERWVVDGGPARGRRHRLGHAAVLRRLRPHAPHVRRADPLAACSPAPRPTCAALLRGGASDREIADTWRDAMWGKLAGHGIDDPGFLQPDRPMSAIGG